MPQPHPTPKQAPTPQPVPRKGSSEDETPATFRDWASI
jgi:hypothetical protein